MTEGKKYDADKPRLDLITPKFIIDVANVLGYGAKKYGEYNWQAVDNGDNRYYAAALRHLLAYRQGEIFDAESGLTHLSHAATNIMFLSYLLKEHKNAKL